MSVDTLTFLGGILIAISLTISIAGLIFGANSIKNGRELALEFHRVKGNDVRDVKTRWFFVFAFYPITADGKQILYPWLSKFKRISFLVQTLWWSALGDFKLKKDYFKLYFVAFAQIIMYIPITALLYSSLTYFTEGTGLLFVIQSFLSVLAIGFFKQYFIIKSVVPAIHKIECSKRDKKLLITFLYLYIVIELAALILRATEFIIKSKNGE